MSRLTQPEIVLRELGITHPSEIDLEAIAWALGAKVRYRHLRGCEARIIGNGQSAIITVNSLSHPRRQRFSIGHELGHWHYHRGWLLTCSADQIERGAEGQSTFERTADGYAANLLMPEYLLDPLARRHPRLTFDLVRTIADLFDTSIKATAIRLIERRHFLALLICHGPTGRKWFARSPEVPSRWFPQVELDNESFAFDILFGNEPEDRVPHKIGADAWFDRREAERYEVTEQTIRSAPDEILTIVLITDDDMLEDYGRRN